MAYPNTYLRITNFIFIKTISNHINHPNLNINATDPLPDPLNLMKKLESLIKHYQI